MGQGIKTASSTLHSYARVKLAFAPFSVQNATAYPTPPLPVNSKGG